MFRMMKGHLIMEKGSLAVKREFSWALVFIWLWFSGARDTGAWSTVGNEKYPCVWIYVAFTFKKYFLISLNYNIGA